MVPTPEQETPPQTELLARVPVADIPQGTDIPLSLFTRFFRDAGISPVLVELGAGDGSKADLVRHELNGLVMPVDVNPIAIEQATQRGMIGFVADATRFEIFRGLASMVLLESNSGVYMEGLLCNQLGDDWKKVLTTADILMRPDGYLLIADVVRPDPSHAFLEPVVGVGGLSAYVDRWQRRYDANQEAARALGITVLDGEFLVARPGEGKEREWGDAATLTELVRSGQVERWAHHIPQNDILDTIAQLGFSPRLLEPRVWWSRPSGPEQVRQPLPGFVGVWQKGDRFRYHPWYAGGTMADRDTLKHQRKIASRTDPGYVADWIARFKRNLPDAEYYFPSLFEYDTDGTS